MSEARPGRGVRPNREARAEVEARPGRVDAPSRQSAGPGDQADAGGRCAEGPDPSAAAVVSRTASPDSLTDDPCSPPGIPARRPGVSAARADNPASQAGAPSAQIGTRAREEALRIRALFEAAGAEAFETAILQPAGPLLDLYGEDIRARAYVTADPLRGERMLRPDFTVAVARAHRTRGAPARYAYAGEVFRRQEVEGRPTEYLQAGIEIFDPREPAARDAEVLALVHAAAEGAALEAVTGDMGLLMAAVRGLAASERRRAALQRHVWRPDRFRALLERFGAASGRMVPDEDAIAAAGPEIGERGADEVAQRLRALRADAAEPALPRAQIEALGALLALRGPAGAALGPLRALASDLPALGPAADAFAERLDALAARGIDPDGLAFEASLGRASMEYYDGFVFQLREPGRPDAPPVASGGRFDALTRALGGGAGMPAVGAILRPEALLAARR